MAQISKIKLDKALEEEMFRQFWFSLSTLRSASTVSSFFSDLLTTTEEVMLAKRFTVAVLIMRGKRPVDIKHTLHVTDTTICSVNSWLKNVKPQTKQIIVHIIKESNWQKVFDRFEELLDQSHPMYHTDWRHAGKDKWQRKMQRTSRQLLR